MRIAVRYMAQLKTVAGVATETVELADSATTADLVARLVERHSGLRSLLHNPTGNVQSTILIFIGDQQADTQQAQTLRDGDVVTLLSPIAGG
jgi:molybdopterin converting factor small subunit